VWYNKKNNVRRVRAGWKNTLKKEENYEKETYACIGALRLLCF
jgi:hypothetical protein